jgi:hypothetical protein
MCSIIFPQHSEEYMTIALNSSWPVRTLSFSHDGQLLALASEDLHIDIV